MSTKDQLLSQLLAGTLFEPTYTIFGVQTDQELIYKMGCCAVLFTIVVGLYSLILPFHYGKFSTSWTGYKVNAKLAWMIQEIPAWLIPWILLVKSPCIYFKISSLPNSVLTILFMAHYFQRSLVYPFRIQQRASPVPVSTILLTLFVCAFNGLYQGHHLLNIERVAESNFFFSGVVLFLMGVVINIYHDGILVTLKKNKTPEGKSEYQIPRGGLFEYVSGANYLGEILEWWGFAVASGKVPQLIFAIFSTIFLGIRAFHHHHYYKKTFGKSYPAQRTALIPFIV